MTVIEFVNDTTLALEEDERKNLRPLTSDNRFERKGEGERIQ